jgi:hypothetical protein
MGKHVSDTTIALSWEIMLGNTARILFMCAVFLAIFSPTMVYVAAFSALLSLVLPSCRAGLPALFRLPSVRIGMLYFLVVIAGIFYTPAIKSDIIKELLVVALPVFFLPLLVTVFQERVWQHRLITVLFASGMLMAVRMLAFSQHWIPHSWNHIFLFQVHYIQQAATVVALGIYLGLYLAFEAKTRPARVTFAILAVFLVVVSLGFQEERVGMVLSFISLLTFFLQHLRKLRWLALMVVGYAILVGILYHVSPIMHKRVGVAIQDVKLLVAAKRVSIAPATAAASIKRSAQTSFGLRYNTAMAAFEASSHRPVFGYGTGAFAMSHKSNPPLSGYMLKHLSTTTPEVGSLFVLMRHGWLGILIFVAFLFSWWRVCRPLGYNQSCLVFAALAILVLADCSYPAFYHSRAWVWLFAVLIAVAGRLLNNSRSSHSRDRDTHENLTCSNR